MPNKLEYEEVERCKQLLDEMKDPFEAIYTELSKIDNMNYVSREYLKEKLNSIQWNMRCLDSIINKEE